MNAFLSPHPRPPMFPPEFRFEILEIVDRKIYAMSIKKLHKQIMDCVHLGRWMTTIPASLRPRF